MVSFLARRLITVVLPTLFGISILVFGAIHLIPGSFVDVMLGLSADVSVEQREQIAASYGLDDPLPVQYLRWLGDVVQGNLGESLRTGEPVLGEIVGRLPATLELTLLATLVSLIIAIPAGILAAVYRGGVVDVVLRVFGLLGLSIPNFLIGTFLVLLVSTRWPILPTTGYVPLTEDIVGNLKSLALPAISLGALLAASVMRMMRSAVLEELGKEYLMVARAKGLSGRVVVMRHAVRNALVPVITV
ncbi:MAG: ABC transporter permease, partial [Chloroflexota bacterium]|nr:ABC transporter permease [Chloroflexota bacterium]